MDSETFWALFTQAFDKFWTHEHLEGFCNGITVFFSVMGGFAGCSLKGKAHLCKLTNYMHMTFPITCVATTSHQF
jgi:hypothetical protein